MKLKILKYKYQEILYTNEYQIKFKEYFRFLNFIKIGYKCRNNIYFE